MPDAAWQQFKANEHICPRKPSQGISSVVCPGMVTCTTPPHMQLQQELLLSAGIISTSTVGEPGAHGVTVAGMHGMGVSTPRAAEVADATEGLARLEHMPKGRIFTMGW